MGTQQLQRLFDDPRVSFQQLKKHIRTIDRCLTTAPTHPVEWLLLIDHTIQPLVNSLWTHGTHSSLRHLHAWVLHGDISQLTLREDWCWAKFLPWDDDHFCIDWVLRGCCSNLRIMAMASPPMRTYLARLASTVDPSDPSYSRATG